MNYIESFDVLAVPIRVVDGRTQTKVKKGRKGHTNVAVFMEF